MKIKKNVPIAVSLASIAAIMFIFGFLIFRTAQNGSIGLDFPGAGGDFSVETFRSEDEFRQYINSGTVGVDGAGFFRGSVGVTEQFALDSGQNLTAPSLGGGEVNRVSDTNVQVKGVDEPDIVKTNGETIFYSTQNFGVPRPLPAEPGVVFERTTESSPPSYYGPQLRILDAFPPQDLSQLTELTEGGEMLLNNNSLVLFNNNELTAYDVSDPANPSQSWTYDYQSNSSIEAARLYNGKVYLVSKVWVSDYIPCPIPLLEGSSSLTIACTDIYRPNTNFGVDTTYTVSVLNAESGEVESSVSFVGSSNQSVIYMSENAIYATYTKTDNSLNFITGFFANEASDIVPQSLVSDLQKVAGYDISEASKLNEFEIIFSRYINSLDSDERARVENELANRMSDYVGEHSRDLETTGIVKINSQNLAIEATGGVPGAPLNQFALDEYQNNLRIATAISGRSRFGGGESKNDVYVLDDNLNQTGSVVDLGLSERIYAVRFIEDKGYVVTFRQIDPFYVLDLSNPSSPELKGELKIPGFSSYLHPLEKDLIVGIGRESSNAKISLFNVSNPQNPLEVDTYILNEFWTEVQSNHHAFLQDSRYKVFFIPAGQSGYVFSYENGSIILEHVVADITAKRAIFINDYLYILGDQKIVILDEQNWSEVNSLSF